MTRLAVSDLTPMTTHSLGGLGSGGAQPALEVHSIQGGVLGDPCQGRVCTDTHPPGQCRSDWVNQSSVLSDIDRDHMFLPTWTAGDGDSRGGQVGLV
jgi:hypothetical protein